MSQSLERNTPSTGPRGPLLDPEEPYRRQARKQAIVLAGAMQAVGVVMLVVGALTRLMPGFSTGQMVILLAIGAFAVAGGFYRLLATVNAMSERAARTSRFALAAAFAIVIVAAIINLVLTILR